MEEKKIMEKLEFLEAEILTMKSLIVEIHKNLEKFIEDENAWLVSQKQLNEARQRIRDLEYENYFLKNQDKISTTVNIKEEQQ